MQEGSPPEPAPESAPPEATDEQQPEPQPEVAEEERTPESVEAIWKNRVAGKDRAHAAETATLRQQLEVERTAREALERQRQTGVVDEQSEAAQWKAKAEAAEQQAADVKAAALVEVRSVKYAAAAEALDDPKVLAAYDEAKLAALNARLSGDEASPPPVIDPNSPRRPTSPPPTREKGIAELESDLKKYEPEFKASLDL